MRRPPRALLSRFPLRADDQFGAEVLVTDTIEKSRIPADRM